LNSTNLYSGFAPEKHAKNKQGKYFSSCCHLAPLFAQCLSGLKTSSTDENDVNKFIGVVNRDRFDVVLGGGSEVKGHLFMKFQNPWIGGNRQIFGCVYKLLRGSE